MRKAHREIVSSRTKPRKFTGKCECCGKSICSCSAYQYVDESNASITNSSPWLCAKCYSQKHGVAIKTDVENYKDWLAQKLMYFNGNGVELNLENVIKILKLF